MVVLKSLWASIEGDPVVMRRIHGVLTIVWFVAAFPIMYFWSENLQFLVFISVYAVCTGHFAAYQASRVEVRQEEIAQEQGVQPHTQSKSGTDTAPTSE